MEFEVDFMVFGRWRLEHYGIISLPKLSIDESTPRGLANAWIIRVLERCELVNPGDYDCLEAQQ